MCNSVTILSYQMIKEKKDKVARFVDSVILSL